MAWVSTEDGARTIADIYNGTAAVLHHEELRRMLKRCNWEIAAGLHAAGRQVRALFEPVHFPKTSESLQTSTGYVRNQHNGRIARGKGLKGAYRPYLSLVKSGMWNGSSEPDCFLGLAFGSSRSTVR